MHCAHIIRSGAGFNRGLINGLKVRSPSATMQATDLQGNTLSRSRERGLHRAFAMGTVPGARKGSSGCLAAPPAALVLAAGLPRLLGTPSGTETATALSRVRLVSDGI
jgi:hypothetical protein